MFLFLFVKNICYTESMKKIFVFIGCILLAVIVVIASVFAFSDKNRVVFKTDKTVGVWWWTKQDADKYLDFAKENDVDEIYYCDYSLNNDTYNFVKQAKEKNIEVYALFGEKEWINDKTNLDALIQKYKIYQTLHSDAKFSGIHLDVEPHQFDDFNQKENEYLTKFVNVAYLLISENPDITFDFDIPAWFDKNEDAYKVKLNGVTKPVYKHMIDIANRVFVMSYRDKAEDIVSFAENELSYATEKNKKIALCVEMNSDETETVSFKEENKQILYEELSKIESLINQDYMISIHHIKTWYELKEK